jgi:hypothetical protein
VCVTGTLYSLELRRKHFFLVILRQQAAFLKYLEAKDESRIFLRNVGNPSKSFMTSYPRNIYDQNLSHDFKLHGINVEINPLNAELNLICHLPALLRPHHIFHVSGLRVN